MRWEINRQVQIDYWRRLQRIQSLTYEGILSGLSRIPKRVGQSCLEQLTRLYFTIIPDGCQCFCPVKCRAPRTTSLFHGRGARTNRFKRSTHLLFGGSECLQSGFVMPSKLPLHFLPPTEASICEPKYHCLQLELLGIVTVEGHSNFETMLRLAEEEGGRIITTKNKGLAWDYTIARNIGTPGELETAAGCYLWELVASA